MSKSHAQVWCHQKHWGPSLNDTNRANRRLLLYAPHGDDGRTFASHYPELWDELKKSFPDRTLWERYVRLEQDTGAFELSRALAESLAQDHPDWSITLIEARLPRALIDCGRTASHAVRNVFCDPLKKWEAVCRDVYEEFYACFEKQVRSHIAAFKSSQIEGSDRETSFYLELHSMANYCPTSCQVTPTEALKESYEGLTEYVNTYLTAERKKDASAKRSIDLITKADDGDVVGSIRASRCFEKVCKQKGWIYAHNEPYTFAPHFLGYHNKKELPGLALDFPKNSLCDGEDLCSLTVSGSKIERMVSGLYQGVLSFLK